MASIRLNTGFDMPILGLGTLMSPSSRVQEAVEYAIDCGYRHIDCAFMHKNEKEIGKAIAKKIKEGVVKREDLFITSKLWCTFHRPERVREGFMLSLNALQLDYLDLYLVHFPVGFEYESATELYPLKEWGILKYDDIDYVETWKGMEKLVEEKLVRSIGISNYNEFQCKRLAKNCKILPAVNQIEVHPFRTQISLIDCCKELGISVTAYSPLVNGEIPHLGFRRDTNIFVQPIIAKIAAKYQKSNAQIAIRFPIERGIAVIPKTVNPERIKENFEVFDFKLTEEDMDEIFKLHKNFRTCHWLDHVHKYNPFDCFYLETD